MTTEVVKKDIWTKLAEEIAGLALVAACDPHEFDALLGFLIDELITDELDIPEEARPILVWGVLELVADRRHAGVWDDEDAQKIGELLERLNGTDDLNCAIKAETGKRRQLLVNFQQSLHVAPE